MLPIIIDLSKHMSPKIHLFIACIAASSTLIAGSIPLCTRGTRSVAGHYGNCECTGDSCPQRAAILDAIYLCTSGDDYAEGNNLNLPIGTSYPCVASYDWITIIVCAGVGQ